MVIHTFLTQYDNIPLITLHAISYNLHTVLTMEFSSSTAGHNGPHVINICDCPGCRKHVKSLF